MECRASQPTAIRNTFVLSRAPAEWRKISAGKRIRRDTPVPRRKHNGARPVQAGRRRSAGGGLMRRAFVFGLIVCLGIAAGRLGTSAQQAPAGREGGQGRGGGRGPGFPPVSAPEKVAENLYMIPGQGGNTAAWITDAGVVIVDTKLANNGQAILDQVKTVTSK